MRRGLVAAVALSAGLAVVLSACSSSKNSSSSGGSGAGGGGNTTLKLVAADYGTDLVDLGDRVRRAVAARVRELTGGRGVDLVLETVGRDTLGRSLRSLRAGGMLAKIGGVSGFGGEIDDDALIDGALRIAGVLVGSRSMLDDLARFVGDHKLRPVIDRAFGFEDAPSAYRHFAAARNPGKVVIDVAAA